MARTLAPDRARATVCAGERRGGGFLLVALFTPIWTGAVHSAADFELVPVAFLLLTL
jgi:hypothetical protein